MDLTERILFLCIGGVIGFILGLIVSRLRVIEVKLDTVQVEVHEVDEIVKKNRDESGAVEWPNYKGVLLFLVIALTVWAAFSSQKAANDAEDVQDQVISLALCNQEFLSKLLLTVNERTEYSTAQAKSNVDLQKSQSAFLTLLLSKPGEGANEKARVEATKAYLDDLTEFVTVSEKQANSFEANPYPTNKEYAECLSKKMQPKESD